MILWFSRVISGRFINRSDLVKGVEEVDTVVESDLKLISDAMVLDNSELGWLGEESSSELRGADEAGL